MKGRWRAAPLSRYTIEHDGALPQSARARINDVCQDSIRARAFCWSARLVRRKRVSRERDETPFDHAWDRRLPRAPALHRPAVTGEDIRCESVEREPRAPQQDVEEQTGHPVMDATSGRRERARLRVGHGLMVEGSECIWIWRHEFFGLE